MKQITFILTLFAVVMSLNASNKIRYKKISGIKYIYLRDAASYYGMRYLSGQKRCQLKSKYSRLIFTYQHKEMSLNGVKVFLLNAPFRQVWDGFISKNDFFYVIDSVLRYRALTPQKIYTIIIDPGHGGKDNGTKGKFYKEKDIVLQIGKILRYKLAKLGYNAILTRTKDTFISLEQRTKICKLYKADLFISIHCNSAGDTRVHGIETFCLTPAGAASTYDRKIQKHKEIGNRFNINNFRLAYEIHKAALIKTKASDRGVKHARFFVLKNASCPAILIETGFLSNAREEKLLHTYRYQNALANGICAGILNYHRQIKRIRNR